MHHDEKKNILENFTPLFVAMIEVDGRRVGHLTYPMSILGGGGGGGGGGGMGQVHKAREESFVGALKESFHPSWRKTVVP